MATARKRRAGAVRKKKKVSARVSGKRRKAEAPAAKVKVDPKGAIVTEEYGREVVRLTKIAKVQ